MVHVYDLASIRTRPYGNIPANVTYRTLADLCTLSVAIDTRDSYRWLFSYHAECLVYEHFARS